MEKTNTFRVSLSNFESLSREVGYWNAISNIQDENGNYDRDAIAKYESLRNKQLDMFEELIAHYNN